MFYWFAKIFLYHYLRLYHRATRTGFENVPKRGPLIVVANHASFLDPWFLGIMFRFRHIRYLMTNEWFERSAFWKWFFVNNGCIAVTIGKTSPSTVKQILGILNKGGVVGIFPEGRVSHDGNLQEFNPGAISIAYKAGVPILPVAICGSYQALSRHMRFPKPRKINIVYGNLLRVANPEQKKKLSKQEEDEIMQNIKNWIRLQLERFPTD